VAFWVILATIGFGGKMNLGNYLYVMLVATLIFDGRNVWRLLTVSLMLTSLVAVKLIEMKCIPLFEQPQHTDFCAVFNMVLPGLLISIVCWSMVEDANFYQDHIIRSRKKLKESNMLKDKLLSVIGHDLSSPLSSLRGILSIGLDSFSPEEQADMIRSLQEQLDITEQTVNGLLEWSYQNYFNSSATYDDQATSVELSEIVDRIFSFYQVKAADKKITLVNRIKPGTMVFMNVDQLTFVVRNIVGNAIKYCQNDGLARIEVWAETAGKHVVIYIKDNGTGIAQERIGQLFELRKRKSTEGTQQEKGAGLGLIFCKEFVENNNGHICVESEPGRGTTFIISLPSDSSHSVFPNY